MLYTVVGFIGTHAIHSGEAYRVGTHTIMLKTLFHSHCRLSFFPQITFITPFVFLLLKAIFKCVSAYMCTSTTALHIYESLIIAHSALQLSPSCGQSSHQCQQERYGW